MGFKCMWFVAKNAGQSSEVSDVPRVYYNEYQHRQVRLCLKVSAGVYCVKYMAQQSHFYWAKEQMRLWSLDMLIYHLPV